MSFNWTQLALTEVVPHFDPHTHEGHAYIAVATLGVASVLTMGMGAVARAQLGTGEKSVVPAGKLSMRGICEFITEMITGFVDSVVGHHGRHYVPMFASIFFFVLVNNLIGMVPGMSPATENINTTIAFGMFIFIMYNFLGIKENGIVNYLKHFMGPVLLLAPLIFIIEMISNFVRPMSLGLRLANVLSGDHRVSALFLDLAPALIPIPFFAMGIFVCILQAFVFTLLSMVYVALATAHDH